MRAVNKLFVKPVLCTSTLKCDHKNIRRDIPTRQKCSTVIKKRDKPSKKWPT